MCMGRYIDRCLKRKGHHNQATKEKVGQNYNLKKF